MEHQLEFFYDHTHYHNICYKLMKWSIVNVELSFSHESIIFPLFTIDYIKFVAQKLCP